MRVVGVLRLASLTHEMRTLLIAVVPLALACVPAESNGTAERENGRPGVSRATGVAPASGAPVQLLSAEAVSIGELAGHAGLLLSDVRGVVTRSDGSVLVAEGANQEVRVFSPDGVYQTTLGRAGQGPGEFETLHALFLASHDSVFVVDLSRPFLYSVDPSLRLSPAHRLAAGADFRFHLEGAIDGERLVTWTQKLPFQFERNAAVVKELEPSDVAIRWTDGRSVIVGQLARPPVILAQYGSSHITWDLPLAPRGHVAIGGGYLALGDSRAYRIQVFSDEGQLVGTITGEVTATPLTAEQFASAFQDNASGPHIPWDRLLRDVQRSEGLPDMFPAFFDLQVDPLGFVWVLESPSGSLSTERTWTIYEPTGEVVARVATSIYFDEVYSVGVRSIAVAKRGPGDIPQVVLIPIQRATIQ